MTDHNFYILTPRLAITYFNPTSEKQIEFALELYKNYTTTDQNGNVKRTIPDRAAAIKMMEERVAQIETTGFGRYLVSVLPLSSVSDEDISGRLQNSIPVGVVTLNLRGPDACPLPDIGFNLLPSARGTGYATEAVEGLTSWYEREIGVTELLGYCDKDNEASIKVLRRVGFELLGVRDVPAFTTPGSVKKYEKDTRLLVWARGLKKDPEAYGLQLFGRD